MLLQPLLADTAETPWRVLESCVVCLHVGGSLAQVVVDRALVHRETAAIQACDRLRRLAQAQSQSPNLLFVSNFVNSFHILPFVPSSFLSSLSRRACPVHCPETMSSLKGSVKPSTKLMSMKSQPASTVRWRLLHRRNVSEIAAPMKNNSPQHFAVSCSLKGRCWTKTVCRGVDICGDAAATH